MKYQLHKVGIDWNTISDYELFLLSYKAYPKDLSMIVFCDLDFSKMELCKDPQNGEIVLYDQASDTKFDRSIYELSVDYIRRAHNISKNVEKAMNETTKIVLIDEAKEMYEMNKDKEQPSILLPLISTLTNMSEFKYGWTDVWNLKINAFMDAVKQVKHIKNAELLLSSGYSGFGVDLKKINKNDINYFYRPDEN